FTTQWKKPLTFGLFFAKADLEYGDTSKTASSSREIILVMPWKQVLAGFLIFAVGLVSGVIPRRKRKKRSSAKIASKSEAEDEASGQCAAIRADGQRCTNQAKPGSQYCGIAAHKKLSTEGQD
ncbi:MAG: hypothetical protein KAX16_05460, partial [Actinomycetia bacterium]|nr:hypothetical protein [Actinomycetes bacterium]